MISRQHKTLFVHVPKCAGQSIEMVFLNELGLSWNDRESLLLRHNPDPQKGPERLAHLFAHEYTDLGYLSVKDVQNYYKFSVVRNPYSRILSELNYQRIKRKRGFFSRGYASVEEYIESIEKEKIYNDSYRHICPQVRYLFSEDMSKILVNDVYEFEKLGKAFNKISQKIFGKVLGLPMRNIGKERIWNMDDISQSDISFLRDFYKLDFEHFGYEM